MNFRLKLIISISLLIAITFGLGGMLLISTSFSAFLDEKRSAAMQSFQTVQSTLYLLNSMGEKTEYTHMADSLSQMEQQGAATWQALSLRTDNAIIYQSGSSALFSAALPTPDAGKCAYTITQDTYGSGLHILSSLSADGATLTLTARFDLSEPYATRQSQQEMFFVIYIAVVLLGILIACVLAFSLTRRLHKLTGAVRTIAGGDLSHRSGLKSHDEFGQLSRDFDAMADKLQENISRLEEDMQRQEAFMGAFAHELKTPMTSIIGYADLIRQGTLDENGKLMAARYIFSEGQRLEKLSFKLLDLLLLKKDTLPMKEVSLRAFLGEVQAALSPSLKEKQITLSCHCESGRVYIEPDLVKSLVYNLVDNASKAIDGSGIIALRGTVLPGGCEIQVIDSGRGMAAEELTKITEAFYRVDKSRSRKQGGAGLGIALCKQIAELHNGSLRFRSAPGQGTQAIVQLYGKEGAVNAAD